MEVAPKLFSILLKHEASGEAYWLQPGFTVAEQLQEHCSRRAIEEWRYSRREGRRGAEEEREGGGQRGRRIQYYIHIFNS